MHTFNFLLLFLHIKSHPDLSAQYPLLLSSSCFGIVMVVNFVAAVSCSFVRARAMTILGILVTGFPNMRVAHRCFLAWRFCCQSFSGSQTHPYREDYLRNDTHISSTAIRCKENSRSQRHASPHAKRKTSVMVSVHLGIISCVHSQSYPGQRM